MFQRNICYINKLFHLLIVTIKYFFKITNNELAFYGEHTNHYHLPRVDKKRLYDNCKFIDYFTYLPEKHILY